MTESKSLRMRLTLTDEQEATLIEAAEPLFARAVAQGMHAPFALDCDYWGREYTSELLSALSATSESEQS